MEVLIDCPQGGLSWHAARAQSFCASEAAAALGVSKYTSRNAMLKQKATGLAEEVTPAKQRLFDSGHEAEAKARVIAERIAGTDLYPVVGTLKVNGMRLLASFDGIDMLNEVVWESKLLNADLVRQVQSGDLEPHYWAQLEHQLLVSGAARALFTTSDGTEDGTHHCWYESKPERRAALIDGWEQFEKDLAAYVPPPAAEPKAVGVSPESLPALRIEVQGRVTASNLAEFKSTAVAVINEISTELETDQDFANAEKSVKWCEDVENRLEAAKERALSQTASIDELFRTIDAIAELTREKRLRLNKLVKDRKEQIRTDIVMGARLKFKKEIDSLNDSLGDDYLAIVYPDFAGVIKGKRTVEGIQNAVDTLLAQSSQSAHASMNSIDKNLDYLDANAADNKHLFPDLKSIAGKASDDFEALVKMRVSKYKQEQEDARNRVLRLEQEHIEREQQALAAQTAQQAIEDAKAKEHEARPAQQLAPSVSEDDGARMKLGDINARIAPLSITADGLVQLGFVPVATDKSAKLYLVHDFPAMREAMREHLRQKR